MAAAPFVALSAAVAVTEHIRFKTCVLNAGVGDLLQVAERLGPGHRVVTVACDSGLKYLQGDLYS